MSTSPSPGVSLTEPRGSHPRKKDGGTAEPSPQRDVRTQLQFDPSSWRVPQGSLRWWYHTKRAFSPELAKKHGDYLLWRQFVQQKDETDRAWQRECDRLQQELDRRNREMALRYKEHIILAMMNLGVLPTVYFANWKSGAKTTLAAYVGSIMSELSRRNCVLLPATSNSKTGASGEITGLTGDHLTLGEFEAHLDRFKTPRDLAERLARTRHGLSVVVEDSRGDIEAKRFTPERFSPVLKRTYALTDGCVLLDAGNDDVTTHEIPVLAARAADVIVFPASNTQPLSHVKMFQTMAMLAKDPYHGRQEGEDLLPGEYHPTANKVRRALIVINGVKPGDEPCGLEQVSGTWSGDSFTVGWDEYVFGGHNRQNVVDLSRIDRKTYENYLDVVIAILRQGAESIGIPLTSVPAFVPEELILPPRPAVPEPDYACNRSA